MPTPRQLCYNEIAVVTLNLYHPVLQGSAAPAAPLELHRQQFQSSVVTTDAGDNGDGLAASTLGLTTDPNNAVTGGSSGI
jgi:hypothetical protein